MLHQDKELPNNSIINSAIKVVIILPIKGQNGYCIRSCVLAFSVILNFYQRTIIQSSRF